MNPLWYLDVISHFLLLPLHHHHHHRHPHSRYDTGTLCMAVPWHGMNQDNRSLDVQPKGSLEVAVTGLDSSQERSPAAHETADWTPLQSTARQPWAQRSAGRLQDRRKLASVLHGWCVCSSHRVRMTVGRV